MGEYRSSPTRPVSSTQRPACGSGTLQTDLNFHVAIPGHPGGARSHGATWVDPMIGAKGRINLGRGFYLTDWAMIGGHARKISAISSFTHGHFESP